MEEAQASGRVFGELSAAGREGRSGERRKEVRVFGGLLLLLV